MKEENKIVDCVDFETNECMKRCLMVSGLHSVVSLNCNAITLKSRAFITLFPDMFQ